VFGDIEFADGGGPLLCKYDSDGKLLWAKRADSEPVVTSPIVSYGGAGALAIDPSGNVIITGGFSGQADFGHTNVVTTGPNNSDSFVARYKPDGEAQWVQVGSNGRRVAADRQGNVYFNGAYPAGDIIMHYGKFAPDGQLLWEKAYPGAEGSGVALDPNDEPIFTGEMWGTVDFDGISVTCHGTINQDILLCKTDAQGNIQWVMSGGGNDPDWGRNIACDSRGNIYLTGVFQRSRGTLGSAPLIPVYANEYWDIFVARLTQTPPLKIIPADQKVVLSWPADATNFVLESATSLPAVSWTTLTNTPTDSATERSVQLPLTGNARFFRLGQP
jgi:hypothetical protein